MGSRNTKKPSAKSPNVPEVLTDVKVNSEANKNRGRNISANSRLQAYLNIL
jgi:hypothetical protein